jgi:NDP-sugar pyrophosphorylase family protein
VQTNYGVIHVNGDTGATRAVTGYEEKPEIPYIVSMGVYVAEPEILEHIPREEHFDVPDLVLKLLDAGTPVGSYIFDGFWLDIGRHDDYELASVEFEERKDQFLPEGDLASSST